MIISHGNLLYLLGKPITLKQTIRFRFIQFVNCIGLYLFRLGRRVALASDSEPKVISRLPKTLYRSKECNGNTNCYKKGLRRKEICKVNFELN